jgi:hypothetical protein
MIGDFINIRDINDIPFGIFPKLEGLPPDNGEIKKIENGMGIIGSTGKIGQSENMILGGRFPDQFLHIDFVPYIRGLQEVRVIYAGRAEINDPFCTVSLDGREEKHPLPLAVYLGTGF